MRTEELADARLPELDVVFGPLLGNVKSEEHGEVVLDSPACRADLAGHGEVITAHRLRKLRAPSRQALQVLREPLVRVVPSGRENDSTPGRDTLAGICAYSYNAAGFVKQGLSALRQMHLYSRWRQLLDEVHHQCHPAAEDLAASALRDHFRIPTPEIRYAAPVDDLLDGDFDRLRARHEDAARPFAKLLRRDQRGFKAASLF